MNVPSELLVYLGIIGAGVAVEMTTDLSVVSMTLSAILGAAVMQLVKRYSW